MIQALTASQTAVRGAHPTRLLLDEIDEMELRILEAAQGQPMDRDGVRAQTVMSSTHQYPDGTVTAMRRRAAELGWPVYEWCYRETLKPHGWLTEDQVTRKRGELSRTMWAVEYELQEPSAEGRAIHPAAVERMFDATLGTDIPAGDLEHLWRGQPGPPAERACPDPAGAWYCTGIDWAQQRHYTVAVVVRCGDTTPLQVVAGYRAQRRPWPEMTERVGALLDEFPGPAVHDATGAGSAIGEFPALKAHRQLQGVTMVGRDRVDLFRNYIAAIERHEIVCPRIDVFYTEHLYCGEDDLFGSGHPPDTVVAMALAYHAFQAPAANPATTASLSDGGAGAPAELARRTGALGRRSWLPTHRRPVASAHSPCLSRPPERMRTNAVCPRLPPRRDPAHDPARNRLDRHPR